MPLTLPLRVGLVGFSWVSLGLHHPTHVLEDAPSFARLRRERWALTTGHLRPSSLSLFHSFTLTFLDSPTLFKSPPHTQNCHPDRSGPIFSFAPFSGASGRVVEGSACLFLCALCVLPSACPEHFFLRRVISVLPSFFSSPKLKTYNRKLTTSSPLSSGSPSAKILTVATRGRVAQLGERLVRNEEVGGSNPLSSTKSPFFLSTTPYLSFRPERPIFSSAPNCGASGRAVEESLRSFEFGFDVTWWLLRASW